MKIISTSLFALLAIVLSWNVMAMPLAYVEDVHYKATKQRLATSDANAVEVVELFFYGCPHCFNLELSVEDWKKDLPEHVKFSYVPAIFNENWIPLAKAFYAAESIGQLDTLHPLFFEAIHIDERRIYKEDTIIDFVAEQGIDRAQFEKAMKSFAVRTKVNKAKKMTEDSGIDGVPTLIVNGKYMTGARLAGSEEEIFDVVDFLVEQERK